MIGETINAYFVFILSAGRCYTLGVRCINNFFCCTGWTFGIREQEMFAIPKNLFFPNPYFNNQSPHFSQCSL